MASYSVNLTKEEWDFVLEELKLRRVNDLDDAYANAYSEQDGEIIKKMIDMSNRITKKIENKNKAPTKKQFEIELNKYKKENKKLKKLIDEQHEELQQIKNKLKEIISH